MNMKISYACTALLLLTACGGGGSSNVIPATAKQSTTSVVASQQAGPCDGSPFQLVTSVPVYDLTQVTHHYTAAPGGGTYDNPTYAQVGTAISGQNAYCPPPQTFDHGYILNGNTSIYCTADLQFYNTIVDFKCDGNPFA